MKILATGVLSLFLTALTGGSTSSVVKVETVYLEPPAVLLRELEPAAPEIKTNLDLLNYAVELRYLVEELNADKRALRWFYEAVGGYKNDNIGFYSSKNTLYEMTQRAGCFIMLSY